MILLFFLSDDDCSSGTINPAYEKWEVQDQILLSLLQLKLSKSILSCVLGAIYSYQVWEQIHDHLAQTKACASQLRTNLCATFLDNNTMREFLGEIKSIADELAGIRCPI